MIHILESLLSNDRDFTELNEYGEEIINLMNIIVINNETKKIKSNAFIEAGKDNLKSAKILYDSKIYQHRI